MASTPRWVARPWAELVVPVVLIMALGATWITMHATGGRGATHTVFQVLALCECGIALLLRWRKPVGALASILVVYALVDLDTITILPVLLALLTAAELRGRRTVIAAATATGVAVAVMPYLHGDAVSLGGRTLPTWRLWPCPSPSASGCERAAGPAEVAGCTMGWLIPAVPGCQAA